MKKLQIILFSLDELELFARTFCHKLRGDEVLFLQGELGAGKTTLTKQIASFYGVSPYLVTSPTFILQRQYQGKISIVHFDLYRLDAISQMEDIGFYEAMDQPGLKIVEWGDRFPSLQTYADYIIQLDLHQEGRKISVYEREQKND